MIIFLAGILPVEVQHRGATSSWVYVFIFPLSPANASLQKWSTLTHLPPCGDVGESSAFLLLLTPSGGNIVWHTSTLPPSWRTGGISSVPAGLRVSDSLRPHVYFFIWEIRCNKNGSYSHNYHLFMLLFLGYRVLPYITILGDELAFSLFRSSRG